MSTINHCCTGTVKESQSHILRCKLPAFIMARSPSKAVGDVTPPVEEDTLDFDDDTLKGELNTVFLFSRGYVICISYRATYVYLDVHILAARTGDNPPGA